MGFRFTFRIAQAESYHQRANGVIFWTSDWLPAIFGRSQGSRLLNSLIFR